MKNPRIGQYIVKKTGEETYKATPGNCTFTQYKTKDNTTHRKKRSASHGTTQNSRRNQS